MKKIFVLCFVCLGLFFLCSCSFKPKSNTSGDTLETKVACCLEKIEGVENYDDEILKTLSVIIRTNIINGNEGEDSSAPSSQKFLDIASSTKGEVLTLSKEQKINLCYVPEDYTWKKEIKKSDLLSFLNKNNISLANIKNIEPVFDENKNFIELVVGGKHIGYEFLKKEFGLESSKITKIEKENNTIIIFGEGKDLDKLSFDICKAESLASSGKTYRQLLKHFFEAYDLKTI